MQGNHNYYLSNLIKVIIMFMKSTVTTLFTLLFFIGVSVSNAAITPSLTTDKEVSFGPVLFGTGSCIMDHLTGDFTFANPSIMCGSSGKGTPGRYVIFANPNKQISIRIWQRSDTGDGLVYIPSGEFISDFETVTISANTTQQIDSGSSGIVVIHLGGQLFVTQVISASTAFDLTRADGIEWSELP